MVTHITPDANGVVVLPEGVSLERISVSGADLVIQLPDGSELIVDNGAIFVPQLVIGDVEIPAVNIAALLIGNEPQPAAGGPSSSGGNFEVPVGDIGPGIGIGDLLPPTGLQFGQPQFEPLAVGVINEEPTVLIMIPDVEGNTTSVNEAGLPARSGEPAGSDSASNSETSTGSIIFTEGNAPAVLSVNGVAITSVGQVIHGTFGDMTITSIAPGDIGYSYTLADNTSGDTTSEDFLVTIVDVDGDNASATLHIDIIDDVPTARADTDSVAAGTYGPETGNVVTGSGTTSDGAGADTTGADDATVTSATGSESAVAVTAGGVEVQGQYGVLTIHSDGSYSYARAEGSPGGVTDTFNYTLTDGDGDTSSTTLAIDIGDSGTTLHVPGVEDAGTLVYESGLPARGEEPAGSNAAANTETTAGTITYTAPDGPATVTVGGVTVTSVGQVIHGASGDLTITSMSAGSIGYSYTLLDNTSGDNTNDTFAVVVTDADGDHSNANLVIAIVDDVPTAHNDTDTVAAGTYGPEGGNVITGVGTTNAPGSADVVGADDATVSSAYGTGAATAVTAGGTAIAGQYGTLTLHSDGSYSYARAAGSPGGVTDTFHYTLTDGDTDASTATLVITIDDSGTTLHVPGIEDAGTHVNEAGLPARGGEPAGSDSASNSETTAGTITYTAPDGPATVTIGGTAVTSVGQVIHGAHGDLTVTSMSAGSVGYSYTLLDNTSGDNTNDTFAVVVTDADGDHSNSNLVIHIIDDVPTAHNDTDTVAAGTYGPEGGNVITGTGTTSGVAGKDVVGADDAHVSSAYGTGAPAAVTAGGTAIDGQYGTLTLHSDGSYSYVRDAGSPGGVTDTFHYTLTDGDTDTSPATLVITIADSGTTLHVPGVEDAGTHVNEAGLPARLGEPAGSNAAANSETTAGTITYTAPDGPATVTLGGVAVTSVGQVFHGASGDLTITSIAGGSIGYSYTLLDNTSGNNTTDTFAVVVTDADGDHSDSNLVIHIVDDVPTAHADTDTVAAGTYGPEGGNVITGVGTTNAPGSADVLGADDAHVTSATGTGGAIAVTVGGVAVTGQYGVLTIASDGTYSYVRDAGAPGGVTDTFHYTLTDGDTDTSTTTLIITIEDGGTTLHVPGAQDEGTLVNEAGLPARLGEPAGSDSASNSETTAGTITYTAPDGPAVVTIGGVPVASVGQVFHGAHGDLTITAIAAGSINYSYTLLDNTSGNNTNDTFAVVVTDADGDHSNANLVIAIVDDVPTAVNDTDTVAAGTYGPETGNVITAVGTTSAGADTVGADDAHVSSAYGTGAPQAVAGGGTAIDGQYGTLTIHQDGSYSYVRDAGSPGGVTDIFHYTLRDGDTDTSLATLVITIDDSDTTLHVPGIEDAGTHVNEAGLPTRPGEPAGSDSASNSETTAGTITYTAPDGPATVTLGGVAVTSVGQVFHGTYGDLTITSMSAGSIGYSYTLLDNTSGDSTSDTFAVVVTDTDGDHSDSNLVIHIIDDVPTAHADVDSVKEDTQLTADGNVITGSGGSDVNATDGVADTVGADNATVTGVAAGTPVSASGSVGAGVGGDHGTLTLNANGSYSYALNPADAAVNALDSGEHLTDTFTYTLTDGDGDITTTTLTITIDGTNDAPVVHADTNWTQEDLHLSASGNVLEDHNHAGAPSGAFADVADTDVDADTLSVTTTGDIAGTYGTLHMNADGSYTYTLYTAGQNLAAYNTVQALDDGETLTDSFNYTATDGTANVGSTLTITVFGNNDAPVVNPDTNWVLDVVTGPNPTTTGNVLENHNHAGAPSGTYADVADTDVDVEPLTVTTTGDIAGTYGTLHLNADGSYTYTLNASNATVNALDTGEHINDVFNYTATDGTTPVASTLTITIFGVNDAPVVTPSTITVSEEGVAGGNPDSVGTSDTTNLAVRGGTLTATDVDGEALTYTFGSPPSLSSGGVALTWTGVGTGTLIGKIGATEYVRIAIDSAGAYTVTLSKGIDHPTTGVEDTRDWIVPVNVSDGTATTASTITVTIEDDSPIAFAPGSTPISGSLTNVAGSSATFVLDADHNINNNVGADQPGNIYFNVTDGQDTTQTSGGEMIELWLTNGGHTVEGRTGGAGGTLIYTVSLDQAGGEYTVTMSAPIDNGSGVAFDDLSGGQAGAPPFKIVASSTADNLELLFTPINAGSVNSDSDDIAAGSQFLVFNTGLRIDFGDFTFHAHGGGSSDDAFTMESHTNVNGFRFSIDQISNGSVADVKLTAYDANEDSDKTIGTANFADDPIDPITEVKVYDTLGNLVIDATGDTTVGGIFVDFQPDGTVIVNNTPTQYSIETFTADGYDRIEVFNAGTGGADGKFSLSELQLTSVDLGDPVPLSIPVTLTDADGDTVNANLDFTIGTAAPPVALDLNGDGLQFVDQSAGVHFDYAGDGTPVATAWVSAQDGLLAVDLNGDGKVNDGSEIVFAVNGSTDLEGLKATYDTNHDGVLSAADTDFAKFGVWQDANMNGVSDAGEFKSLSDMGIVSINLTSDGVTYTAANGEAVVSGETTFTYADGSSGTAGDVAFAYTANRIADEAARAASYTNSLAAAAMIAVAAAGFAAAAAPALDLSAPTHYASDVAVSVAPAVVDTHVVSTTTDAFDGGVKDTAPAPDTVQTTEHDTSSLDHASVDTAPAADQDAAPLLAASDFAPAANDAPIFIDTVQMPAIGAIAPVVAAAPAAAPALVAEVLADALSGGADPSVSIDHLLSSLPVADAKVALVAQLGADFSADALTLSGATHLPSVFGMETFTVQHDSVAVHA